VTCFRAAEQALDASLGERPQAQRERPGVLVSGSGALTHPGQPHLQELQGLAVSNFCRQPRLPHAMLPRQPASQQVSVINHEFARLIHVLVAGQPPSQLMQGRGSSR
jgi:hypothetical protein